MHNLLQDFESYIFWVITLFTAGITWLIRNILTNGKRIDMIEGQLNYHRELREADHESIKEVKEGVNTIREYLLEDLNRRREN